MLPCLRAYKNRYMCSPMWNVQHSLVMVSLNIYKPTQMNNEMQILSKKQVWYETEHHGQSRPKSIGTLTVLRCIFGQNLEILTSIGGDLSRRQAQNGVNFDFSSSIWPWSSRSIAQKTIEILTKVFYISGPNLVILAWTVDWTVVIVWTSSWLTDTHTGLALSLSL